MIRLTSFLRVWFQCVRPLMLSCNTYHLTWVSLTLDEGYLLTAALPDLQRGSASVVINHEAHTSATFCSFPRPCDSLPSAAPPHLCLGFQNSVSYYYFIVLAKSFILLWKKPNELFGQPSVIFRTLQVSVKACLLGCFPHSLPVYYPRAMLLQCLQNQGFTMRLAVLLDSDSESHAVFTKLHLRFGCRRKQISPPAVLILLSTLPCSL